MKTSSVPDARLGLVVIVLMTPLLWALIISASAALAGLLLHERG